MSSNLKRVPRYTLGEEITNAVTHGAGAALAVAGTVLLLIRASDRWGYVSASVYGASLIILFTMSCLYHAISHPTAKYVMRVFDHTSIFLLIAGTYTPLTLVTLRAEIPWLGWSIFGVVWAAAAVGITLTAVSVERFKKFAMVCYIASGWCIAAAIVPLMKIMDTAGLILMLIGGIGYTVGLVFYALKIKYMHSIWHLFVLGGAVAHYFCVLFYVL